MDVVAWILGVILIVAGVVTLVRARGSTAQIVRGVAFIFAGLIAGSTLSIFFS